MMKWTCYIVSLFSVLQFSAQQLSSSLSKPQISIGEPVVLKYEVSLTDTSSSLFYRSHKSVILGRISDGDFSAVTASTYEIEILRDFQDTLVQSGQGFLWSGEYTITAWDSAWVVLPPETIIIGDSTYYFEPLLLEVVSPKADPSKDIYDIHEEFSDVDDEVLAKHLWWVIPVVLALALALYFVLRKKKTREPKIALIPLRDRIIQQINDLEQTKLYATDLKEYYYHLSIIIRRFLAEHYQLSIMERTTGEIILLLRQYEITEETIAVIESLLNKSDMVKFAKSTPPTADAINNTNQARQIVDEVASLELKPDQS